MAADTTPDAFTFIDQTGVTISMPVMSNTITVTGINTAAAISITGGQYQINSGAWTATPGTVNNNDTVTVRQTSSPNFSTTTDAVLAIGGVSDTFSVTTLAPDGDIDNSGFVEVFDALKALRMTAGIEASTASDLARGDVAPLINDVPQPDGKITIGDVVVILRRAIGLVDW